MAQFQAYSPNVEVAGGGVVPALSAGFPAGTEKIGISILEKHGIINPVPGQWYLLQPFLDALKEISERLGTHMLTRIGAKVVEYAQVPPGITTLEQILSSMDAAYHANHRNGELGHYTYTYVGLESGLQRAKMVCTGSYPCAFDLGAIDAFSQRFKPADSPGVVVRHDDTQPCRAKGQNSCTYIISWG